ncbi:MAG: hypothetical protein MJ052_01435 [Sphaerochaetaceae bacterium]|nr:hypothetical protein [Sphaerochaetaceae bacterium]
MKKVQQIAPKDFMASFGELKDGVFENVLNINKADVSRMTVKIQVAEECNASGNVTFKLSGSDDNIDYSVIAVTPAIDGSKLTVGANFSIAIPDSYEAKYLKLEATGSVSGGKITGAIDTYMGV